MSKISFIEKLAVISNLKGLKRVYLKIENANGGLGQRPVIVKNSKCYWYFVISFGFIKFF